MPAPCRCAHRSLRSISSDFRVFFLCRSFSVSSRFYSTAGRSVTIDGADYPADSWTNVPDSIIARYGRQLHVQPDHPLCITRKLIESCFPGFKNHNNLPGVVSVDQNFNSLGFAADHPGRNKTDTYYINKDTLLRTHTTAHEVDLFHANTSDGYTMTGDVYRRDAIDHSHYPIFHQMEGALTWDRKAFSSNNGLIRRLEQDLSMLPGIKDIIVKDPNPSFHEERNPRQEQFHSPEEVTLVSNHLKLSLEHMVFTIFQQAEKALVDKKSEKQFMTEPFKVRWVESFFPHTSPSWELEVWWQGDWLEVLGCGVIDQKLLTRAGVPDRIGWAFGLGLERIAMVLFGIPDIRLFWSTDQRFLKQFKEGRPIQRFQRFSKHPPAPRDVAFWLPATSSSSKPVVAEWSSDVSTAGGQLKEPVQETSASALFHENDLMEIARETAGDMVEDVSLVDDFTHKETGRRSLCYRITYRSLEKTLSADEANGLHEKIREQLVRQFGVELR